MEESAAWNWESRKYLMTPEPDNTVIPRNCEVGTPIPLRQGDVNKLTSEDGDSNSISKFCPAIGGPVKLCPYLVHGQIFGVNCNSTGCDKLKKR